MLSVRCGALGWTAEGDGILPFLFLAFAKGESHFLSQRTPISWRVLFVLNNLGVKNYLRVISGTCGKMCCVVLCDTHSSLWLCVLVSFPATLFLFLPSLSPAVLIFPFSLVPFAGAQSSISHCLKCLSLPPFPSPRHSKHDCIKVALFSVFEVCSTAFLTHTCGKPPKNLLIKIIHAISPRLHFLFLRCFASAKPHTCASVKGSA